MYLNHPYSILMANKINNLRAKDAEPIDYQQQLLDYQARISTIMESFTDAYFEVDADWLVGYWNHEAERILMVLKVDILGCNIWEHLDQEIKLLLFAPLQNAVSKHIAVRFEQFYATSQLWVEVVAFPNGQGLSVYVKDVSAGKYATENLERERKKYNDLFNLSPVPQWVYDLSSFDFLDVNQAAVDHYGYSKAQFLSMGIKDIRPEEDRATFEDLHCSDVFPGLFSRSSVRHQKRNGEIMFVCVEGNSVSFHGRDALLVMVIDRTKELESGRALQESLRRFDIVSKATSDVIWDWDMLTGEIRWNKGLKGIFGHKMTNSNEQWHKEHIHPDDLEKVEQRLHLSVKKQKTKIRLEYRFRCADGSYRDVLDRAFVIFNEHGLPLQMIGSMQDISEKVSHIKAIEKQNEKLKEISWIQSHKVRSPLAKILSLVELLAADKTESLAIEELLLLLEQSAMELDQVLTEIIKKTR